MTELYYYEGLWWYATPQGEMCCPPFVREWEDVEKYFGGEEVTEVMKKRDQPIKTPYARRNLKRVRCAQYDDKMRLVKVWPSVLAAAKGTGLSTTSVRSCMSGKAQFVRGKTFRKVN